MGLFSCFTAGFGVASSAAKALAGNVENPEKRRFLEAAKDGYEDRIQVCLADNPELVLSHSIVNRKTAAHLAAESGHIHILEALTECLLCQASSVCGKEGKEAFAGDPQSVISSLVNAQDDDGRTPLSLASEHGHVDCARFLLANGADRLIADKKGNTTLHYASWRCHLGIIFMLLGDFTEDPQSQAQAHNPSMIPPPSSNASFNANASAPATNNQSTVSEHPSSNGSLQQPNSAEGTLTGPARLVDMQNIFGFAPLQYAAWRKQPAVVQVLLQYGADMLIKNPRAGTENSILCAAGSTPLHLAAFRGHIEISRILLKTYYERFLEPMLLAQAGEEADPAAIARSLRAVDPRTQLNSLKLMPHQVAYRVGFVPLSMLLRPNIPIIRLFSEDERAVRMYGPPQLKVLCAEALNRKLLASLEYFAANPPKRTKLAPAVAPAQADPSAAAAVGIQQQKQQQAPSAPFSPHKIHSPKTTSPTIIQRAHVVAGPETRTNTPLLPRHSSASQLPTVVEAEDESFLMSREQPSVGSRVDTDLTNSAGCKSPRPTSSGAQPDGASMLDCTSPSRTTTPCTMVVVEDTSSGAASYSQLHASNGASQVQPTEAVQGNSPLPYLTGKQPVPSASSMPACAEASSSISHSPALTYAASLDLWRTPSQQFQSQPSLAASPFAAAAAAPPLCPSLGGNQPRAPATQIEGSTSKAGTDVRMTASALPGQDTSSCEQYSHVSGRAEESLLLPTPPRSETSSPILATRNSMSGTLHSSPSLLPGFNTQLAGSQGASSSAGPNEQGASSAGLKTTCKNGVSGSAAAATAGGACSSAVINAASNGDANSRNTAAAGPSSKGAFSSNSGAASPFATLPDIHAPMPIRPMPCLPSMPSPLFSAPAAANTASGQPCDAAQAGSSGASNAAAGAGSCSQQAPHPQPENNLPTLANHPSPHLSPLTAGKRLANSMMGQQGADASMSLCDPTAFSMEDWSRRSNSGSLLQVRSAILPLESANSNPILGPGPNNGPSPLSQLFRSASSTHPDQANAASQANPTSPGSAAASGFASVFRPVSKSTNVKPGIFSSPNSPIRNPSPFRGLRLKNQPPLSAVSADGSAGPSLVAGRSGSLRGGLRGLLNPNDKPARHSRSGSRSNVPSIGHRRKSSMPADPLALLDVQSTHDDNPDNDEAHEALSVECGIHHEGVTDRPEAGQRRPRVFMSTKGGTVTLSHTPSMPILDRVVTDVAGSSGQYAQPSSNAQPSSMGHKTCSIPALSGLAEDVAMYASPLYTMSSLDGSVGAASATPTNHLSGLPRQDGTSMNLLYSMNSSSTIGALLPGEASKPSSHGNSASQLQDDALAEEPHSAAGTFNMVTNGGQFARKSGSHIGAEVPSPQFSGTRPNQASDYLGRQASGNKVSQPGSLARHTSGGAEGPLAHVVTSADNAERTSLNGSIKVVSAAGDGAMEVEEEEECGVCMESMASLRMLPCTHTICGPCAHRMCSMFIQRAPHCPFCRCIIADVTASCLPYTQPH